jgi:uncharacterized membrane protein YjfL (UPF0719 family)
MDFLQLDYAPLALGFAHVLLGVVVLVIAKLALGFLSPYSTDQETTTRDNPAFGLAISGYYAATVIIYLGAAAFAPLPLDAGANAVFMAIASDLAWTLAGIVALNGSRWVMDRLLAAGVRNDREIVDNRNRAAGAVEGGAYVASALVLAGAIRQPGGSLWTAAVLFLLGQCALILMGRLYQHWAGYDVATEVRAGNLAAGIAFAMTLVALALLMLKAMSGEFAGWAWNLSFFAFDAVVGLLLLLFLRWLVDLALLPNARIAEEIVRDRNINVGLIEGVLAVGISAIILFVF